MKRFITYNLDISTLTIFKSCFDKNGSHKKVENIDWQYLKNPTSNSVVDILFDTEAQRTAAIYALFCVKFKIEDKIAIGAQSLDTLTDLEYRGLGLFFQLAKNVYSKSEKLGLALVYGFPNKHSFPIFKKLLKWQVLDPLPFMIKPLRSKYFTKNIKILSFLPNINLGFTRFSYNKKYVIREEDKFPVEVNYIWEIFSKDIKVGVIRDHEYLTWRYILKPNESYKIVHCYTLNNVYLGFVIYAIKEKHNGKIAYIMELIYDLEKPEVGKLLLKYAIAKIKAQKADCILSWCLDHSPNFNIFRKELFIKMPEKLRPIELHFGAFAFNKQISSIINKRKNWYISYSDSDTV